MRLILSPNRTVLPLLHRQLPYLKLLLPFLRLLFLSQVEVHRRQIALCLFRQYQNRQ